MEQKGREPLSLNSWLRCCTASSSSITIHFHIRDVIMLLSFYLSQLTVKTLPHQQQCRSNRQQRCQLLRQCCIDIVAGVDRAFNVISSCAKQITHRFAALYCRLRVINSVVGLFYDRVRLLCLAAFVGGDCTVPLYYTPCCRAPCYTIPVSSTAQPTVNVRTLGFDEVVCLCSNSEFVVDLRFAVDRCPLRDEL